MKIRHLLIPLILAFGLGLILALLWILGGRSTLAVAALLATPPPVYCHTISPTMKGSPCTSVYTITNQGSAEAAMLHQFYDEYDHPGHDLYDMLAAGTSQVYDLADIDELPDGYIGYVIVSADQPFTYTLNTCPVLTRTCWGRINHDLTDYTTVQAAVDAANDGDVVKVAGYCAGVEARAGVTQTVYISKSITLRGGYTTTNWTTPDPDANPTTLDAQGQGRGLFITGDISPTVEGLRITGGDVKRHVGSPPYYAGGGIYVITATAIVRNNDVFNNIANYAGGLHLYHSAATLSGNTVSSNTAWYGGGMYLDESAATLSGNTITANTAIFLGGGLYLDESAAALSNNTISANVASFEGQGGGLYLHESAATLSGNIISINTVQFDGGGLYLNRSNVTLSGNTISSNTALYGGGLYLDNSDAMLSGNTIIANAARGHGGGLVLSKSDAILINNVVANNQANTQGSGLSIYGSSPWLLHTTIACNSGGDGSALYVKDDHWSGIYSSMILTNTILVSHTVGISITGGNTVTVNGVLWYNAPITVSQSPTATVMVQNQHTGNPAFDTDGYHITPASVAIDAGVDAGVITDIDDDPRPIGRPDIGADEWGTRVFLPLVLRNH